MFLGLDIARIGHFWVRLRLALQLKTIEFYLRK